MKYITFILRDKNIKISLEELESICVEEWYLTNLIKYTDLEGDELQIEINEDTELFQDILDSFRFRNLIITDSRKINYLLCLAEKWTFPEWLLESIKLKIREQNLESEIKKKLVTYSKCLNCHTVYKEEENHSEACNFHPGELLLSGIFKCCGFKNQNYGQLTYYCRQSYHMANKQNEINILERLKKINDKNKS